MDDVKHKCLTCIKFDKCYSEITLCKVMEGDYKYYKEDSTMIQIQQDYNNGHWDDSGDR
jgi:hypothetical protein